MAEQLWQRLDRLGCSTLDLIMERLIVSEDSYVDIAVGSGVIDKIEDVLQTLKSDFVVNSRKSPRSRFRSGDKRCSHR